MSGFKDALKFILMTALFFAVIMGIFFGIAFRHPMKVIDVHQHDLGVHYESLGITRQEAIDLVNEHFGIKYTLVEKDNLGDDLGRANIVFRKVYMLKDLSPYGTIITLTHELCHLKNFCLNETYTNYMTFKELYNSDNEILRKCALYFAQDQCLERYDAGTKYDVAYYIMYDLGVI